MGIEIYRPGSIDGAYTPEEDGGAGIAGEAFLGADMWVPEHAIKNKGAFLRAATVMTQNTRTGDLQQVRLAKEVGNHIVVARHLFTEDKWLDRLSGWTELKLDHLWENIDFGDRVTPRSGDQELAWESFSKQECGILNLSCGKGKTVMALKKIAQRGYPALVIVNNTGLLDQWKDRALEFLSLPEEDIGIVQGPRGEWDKSLVIGMIHTIANRSGELEKEVRRRFGTIVFDEVHHLAAAKFSLTAPLFYGNRYGLTATPKREDGLEPVYYAQIGPIFYTDTKGELESSIYFKPTDTQKPEDPREIEDRTGEFSAGRMYKYLANHEGRNEVILDIVAKSLESGRKILVLVHAKDHPEILLGEFVASPCMNMYTAGAVSGKTPGPQRTQIIEDSNVTFATFQVAKEGLDVASLDTLVLATPFKSWGGFQQGKGRIERRHKDKKDPLVIVLDDINIGPAHAMCKSLRRQILAHGFRFKNTK